MFLLESKEGLFALAFILSFGLAAFSWIGFARLSVARLEKHIKAEGQARPAAWDGLGVRVLFYAQIIAFPSWKHQANPLYHHIPIIQGLVTTRDRRLSRALVVFSNLFLIVGLLGIWLLDID